jgi:glycosyltransferase involved in cell wall biosynthesis
MTVSAVIATKNRLAELRRTWRALQQLNPPPLEVLITTDGCTEDIVAAVKAELPQARVFVNQIGLGSVASRDRMIREARGDLVLALDDDSYPEQLDCITRIVPFFEQWPKLAVSISSTPMSIPKHCANKLWRRTSDTFVCQPARCCADPLIFNYPL